VRIEYYFSGYLVGCYDGPEIENDLIAMIAKMEGWPYDVAFVGKSIQASARLRLLRNMYVSEPK